MPQLTHSFLPRAWGRANTGSVPAIHSWVFRNRVVPQPDRDDCGRSAHSLARRPRRPKAAERSPLAPADPGALALRGRSARPRPPSGRPGARTPCGLAGGQGAGGLPRRPRGPQDGGGTRLSPPRRLSGSLPFPPQPARQRQTARRGAEGRSGAAAPTLRPGVGEGSTAGPPRRRPPDPAWLGRVPDNLPLNLRSEGGSRTRICSCFAMAPEADAIGDSAERGRARGSLAGAGDGVGAGSAEL